LGCVWDRRILPVPVRTGVPILNPAEILQCCRVEAPAKISSPCRPSPAQALRSQFDNTQGRR